MHIFLIYREIKDYFITRKIAINLFTYILFIAVVYIFSKANIGKEISAFFAVLSIILPIILLGAQAHIFQQEFDNGQIEFKLHVTSIAKWLITSLISYNIMVIIILTLAFTLLSFIYHLDIIYITKMSIIFCLVSIYINFFSFFISIANLYSVAFATISNLLIYPFIIPIVIYSSLYINNFTSFEFTIAMLCALNLILGPVVFNINIYLLKNIYNA